MRKLLSSSSSPLKTLRFFSTDLSSITLHCSSPKRLRQIHGFFVPRGLHRDNLLLCRLVEACASLGLHDYAYLAFAQNKKPNIVLYNTMIRAFSESDSAERAVVLYRKIRRVGLRPDCYSFPFVLRAVVGLCDVGVGREIHCQVVCGGFGFSVHVVNALVRMYSPCGCVSDARKVFDEMPERDLALWNVMVSGYVKVGDVDGAWGLFEVMPERNVVSWTSVISGYVRAGRPEEAIGVFRRMEVEGVKPDEVTMLALLSACADLGALELGEWIRGYVEDHALHRSVRLDNALIDMYAKSGNIEKAVEVFEYMKHRSVVTWTTMISGLALHGLGREALEMFRRMEKAGVRPNAITFIAILSACCHVGSVEVGRWYFNLMESWYSIQPNIKHYGCMIDLLGRAGYLHEAHELVLVMPFEPNAAIWGSLLAGSNVHRVPKLGECALQQLIKLEPHNSGNYTLLSNIYAATGKWNESRMVRKLMRDKGVKKVSGRSLIELDSKIYEFVSGDTLHPQLDKVYEILCDINGELKMSGLLQKEQSVLLEFDSRTDQISTVFAPKRVASE